jgi:hypothetical protein
MEKKIIADGGIIESCCRYLLATIIEFCNDLDNSYSGSRRCQMHVWLHRAMM